MQTYIVNVKAAHHLIKPECDAHTQIHYAVESIKDIQRHTFLFLLNIGKFNIENVADSGACLSECHAVCDFPAVNAKIVESAFNTAECTGSFIFNLH